jgi:transcriptional regulator with XRE-family HTH domain
LEVIPAYCRAARAILNWTKPKLAEAAGLGLSTVVDFERGHKIVSAEAVQAIRRALESAGVSGRRRGFNVKLRKMRFQPSCARRAPIRLDSYRRGASLPFDQNASPARAERDIAVAEDVALDTTFAALLVILLSLAFRGSDDALSDRAA